MIPASKAKHVPLRLSITKSYFTLDTGLFGKDNPACEYAMLPGVYVSILK